jgi:hypothetical protein
MDFSQFLLFGGNVMTAVPSAAEALMAMHHLGTPKKVYKPHTILSVIAGLCLITFAFAWIMLALILTGSPLPPANQIPTLLLSTDPTLSTLLTILGIVFPLVGLIFVGVGLRIIITALLNQSYLYCGLQGWSKVYLR